MNKATGEIRLITPGAPLKPDEEVEITPREKDILDLVALEKRAESLVYVRRMEEAQRRRRKAARNARRRNRPHKRRPDHGHQS